MIKKLAVCLAFAAVGLLLAIGVQAESVRGEGKYMSNTLTELASFKAIDVRGDVQVDVWQRGDQTVTVSGKNNLVTLADIRVEDHTLIIDFKRPIHIKGSHALHVAIGVPNLESISARNKGRVRLRGAFDVAQLNISAGDSAYVTGDWIKADHLRAQAMQKAEIDLEHVHVTKLEAALFDKAEMELSGYAEEAQLINNGSQELEGADLRVNQAHVQINGTGDVETFAVQNLKAEALGRGSIVYHGRPVLQRSGNTKRIHPAFDD